MIKELKITPLLIFSIIVSLVLSVFVFKTIVLEKEVDHLYEKYTELSIQQKTITAYCDITYKMQDSMYNSMDIMIGALEESGLFFPDKAKETKTPGLDIFYGVEAVIE